MVGASAFATLRILADGNVYELRKMAGAPGFAHYVIAITAIPASAPLRSLTRPSMVAFLTLSQRSLRFESWLMEMFTN